MKSSSLMMIALFMAAASFSAAQPGGDTGGDGSAGGGGSGGGDGSGGGVPAASSSSATGEACSNSGTSANYEESLSVNGTLTERSVSTDTGCPNHISIQINPNTASVNPVSEEIPAYPMMFADGGTTDLSEAAMSIGIMRNGVALFSAYGGKTAVVDYETTAFYVESDTFDLCGGHATTDGSYHYHSTPGCLQEHAMEVDGTTAEEHSPILGWSFDGFPVYGQLGPGGVEMLMCGADGADATFCVDTCSGYEGELPGTDDFKYRYYTTCGFDEAFFPFVVNCFRGCCPDGMTCNRHVEACGDTPEEGFTADYVPEVTVSLDDFYETDLIDGDDTDFLFNMDAIMDCSLYLGIEATSTIDGTVSEATPAPSAASTDALAPGSTASPAAVSVTPAPSSAATIDTTSGATPSPAASRLAPGSTESPAAASSTPAPSSDTTGTGENNTSGASSLFGFSSVFSLVVAAMASVAATVLWGV